MYAGKKKTKFSCNRQGIILQRGTVRRKSFCAFYNANECDNDDESYHENNEQ